MNQIMGNLFFRKVQPNIINNMDFFEMKYWNKWHETMAEAEERELNKAKVKK